jgi:hypothetical protein
MNEREMQSQVSNVEMENKKIKQMKEAIEEQEREILRKEEE